MLVPLFLAFQSLVAGETCPAPVDVEARVRTILHLRPEQELAESFAVERHESGLYVELRSAEAAVIGQRTLPVEGSCDDLAQAAAVVLSAWLSDVHPDFASALPPAPEPAPSLEPAPAAEPTPPVMPALEPPAAPTSPPSPPSPRPPPRRLELALGLGAELVPRSFAAVGFVVVDYAPATTGWGVSAFAAASWPRELPLGPGFFEWRRWPVGIGPSLRLATGGVRWDASAGPALAWMHFSASKFERTWSREGFDWGGFLHLRAASRGRAAGVFALADVRFFPGDSGASATYLGGGWRKSVPSFASALAIGAWLSP